MLRSYKWMDWVGMGWVGSLCGAIVWASLCDANNEQLNCVGGLIKLENTFAKTFLFDNFIWTRSGDGGNFWCSIKMSKEAKVGRGEMWNMYFQYWTTRLLHIHRAIFWRRRKYHECIEWMCSTHCVVHIHCVQQRGRSIKMGCVGSRVRCRALLLFWK